MKQKLFSGVNEGFVQTALLTLKEHALSQCYATAAPFTRRGTLRTAHPPSTGLQSSLSGNQPHIQMCRPGNESEFVFISYERAHSGEGAGGAPLHFTGSDLVKFADDFSEKLIKFSSTGRPGAGEWLKRAGGKWLMREWWASAPLRVSSVAATFRSGQPKRTLWSNLCKVTGDNAFCSSWYAWIRTLKKSLVLRLWGWGGGGRIWWLRGVCGVWDKCSRGGQTVAAVASVSEMVGAADADESMRSWQWRGWVGGAACVSSMSEGKAETKTWRREHARFPMKVHLGAFRRVRAADERWR